VIKLTIIDGAVQKANYCPNTDPQINMANNTHNTGKQVTITYNLIQNTLISKQY